MGYFFNGRALILVIVIDMNEWFTDSVVSVIMALSTFSIISMDVIKTAEDADNYDYKEDNLFTHIRGDNYFRIIDINKIRR